MQAVFQAQDESSWTEGKNSDDEWTRTVYLEETADSSTKAERVGKQDEREANLDKESK